MREGCLDCARKHLAQAEVLILEYATGDYPRHKWYAVGHMAEASDELMADHPELARTVRESRLRFMDDPTTNVDIGDLIDLISAFDIDEIDNELAVEVAAATVDVDELIEHKVIMKGVTT